MADIILFKSRARLEQERKEKVQAEWEEWLEYEDQYLGEAVLKNGKSTEMTEQEIIEDVKQRLTDKEIQGIKEIANLLDLRLGK
ncbi:hypothetical protein [Virgibacillus sediminis]|uniref:Uncharacterized protein n=1 Tax=Virgibacillus sediminis TaxID=202260 RepID=A0ABV7A1L7_9BACI